MVFDYGCGGTPYRRFFSAIETYVGADMLPGPTVDEVLLPNGMSHQPSGTFGGVLSSQVLEHVRDPAAYLAEAFRLLKPGGVLILTTHGLFPEHKCPDDFYHWTAQGLETLVASTGFAIEDSMKIACGIRGGIQLLHYIMERSRGVPVESLAGITARCFARGYRWALLPSLNWLATRIFGFQGLLPAGDSEAVYLGVGICARKPLSL